MTDPADLVGTVLDGRYEVVRKLGEGAMGAVYLARHVRMERMDAIKVLRAALANDREAIRRFERGARNVSAIRHPNVCTIYDYHEAGGLRFMAMEFIDGPTLKDILEAQPNGALPVARAVDIAVQTAAALDAAHESGIVHRDLKPGNIMVESGKGGRDVVKVVDFDIAKGTEGGEEVTRLGFVIGTPEYMSPEQLMGEALDRRSDVYSLGLVLVRMIAGNLPFRAEGTQDVMLARLTSQPMRVEEMRPDLSIPPALQHAIDRALQRKPADRQTDAEEFAREIRAALAAPAPAASSSPTTPAVPATRVQPATPSAGTPATTKTGNRWLLYGGLGAAGIAVLAYALTQALSPADGGNTDPLPIPPAFTDTGTPNPDTGRTVNGDTTTPGPINPPPPPPPPPPPDDNVIRFESAAAIGTTLADISGRVITESAPPAGELRAIRDTLEAARQQATTDPQRRSAALLLAWVAFHRRDYPECLRRADEAESLGADASAIRASCTGQ